MKRTLIYLLEHDLISENQFFELESHYQSKPLSIYWHIRVLLYLGVTLIATSLGILIYQNIDTIGHLSIVSIIGLASAGCFVYAFKKVPKFTPNKFESESPWFDYIVLLGALLFLTFEGYLQYQYNIFGNSYGLATIIPAIALYFIAYRFDHIGILSLGITLFSSWLGISLTPKSLFLENDFSTNRLIIAGVILCIVLIVAGYISIKKNFKEHFHFTYYNFGFHLGAVAILSAAFNFDFGWFWVFFITPLLYLAYQYSQQNKSFYFLLCAFGYAYIASSYIIIELLINLDSDFILAGYFLMIYFIGTAVYAIKFLREAHKKMSDGYRV